MSINLTWTFVLLTHDRPSNCQETLHSIWKHSTGFPRVIIVDNAKKYPVGTIFEKYWRGGYPAYYLCNDTNLCAYGRNFGTNRAWEMEPRSPFIAYIDDDVILQPNWELHVTKTLEDGDVYATGPWGWDIYPDYGGFDMQQKFTGDTCQYLDGSFWLHYFDESWRIPEFWKDKTWYAEAYQQFHMSKKGHKFRVCHNSVARHYNLRGDDYDLCGDRQAAVSYIKKEFGREKEEKKATEKRAGAGKTRDAPRILPHVPKDAANKSRRKGRPCKKSRVEVQKMQHDTDGE